MSALGIVLVHHRLCIIYLQLPSSACPSSTLLLSFLIDNPYRPSPSMDFPRLTPPAISIHDVNGEHSNRRPAESCQQTTPGQLFSSSAPMPIPSKEMPIFAPPPLPPPPRINDLENGHDAGWLHANPQESGGCKLAPINPGSSLCGGQLESISRGDQHMSDDQHDRPGRVPLSRNETQIKIEPPPPPPVEEGFRNPPSAYAPGM